MAQALPDLEQCIRLLWDPLRALAYYWTGDTEVCKDVVQETLIVGLRQYERFVDQGYDAFRKYLKVVCISKAKDSWTRQHRLKGDAIPVPNPTAPPDVAAQMNEMRDKLDPLEYQILFLHAAGWRIREIAEKLAIPKSTVKDKKDRAQQNVRRILEHTEKVNSGLAL